MTQAAREFGSPKAHHLLSIAYASGMLVVVVVVVE